MRTSRAATSTSASRASPRTVACRASGPIRSRSRNRIRSSRTRATFRSGRRTRKGRTRGGIRPGAGDAPRRLGPVCGCAGGRLQHPGGARRHARMARPRAAAAGAGRVRARLARRASGGAAGGRRARRAAAAGSRRARLRRGRPAARGDRGGRLGGARRRGWLPARTQVTREQIYGRRPVREALRGRREVLEVWATERAVKAEGWLRDVERPRVQTRLERELSEAAGTRDHQGVLAWCEPYRYADGLELAAADRPLLACLDQVTDPRNLGAVIRSAEGAGANGVVVPAHGSATVTPAVCRASAGAVEHLPVAVVPNLARYLGEVKH